MYFQKLVSYRLVGYEGEIRFKNEVEAVIYRFRDSFCFKYFFRLMV